MNCILSRTFLNKEPIYNLTLEINDSFPMCVCVCVIVITAAIVGIVVGPK